MSTTSPRAKSPSAKLQATCCMMMAAAVVTLSTRETSEASPAPTAAATAARSGEPGLEVVEVERVGLRQEQALPPRPRRQHRRRAAAEGAVVQARHGAVVVRELGRTSASVIAAAPAPARAASPRAGTRRRRRRRRRRSRPRRRRTEARPSEVRGDVDLQAWSRQRCRVWVGPLGALSLMGLVCNYAVCG